MPLADKLPVTSLVAVAAVAAVIVILIVAVLSITQFLRTTVEEAKAGRPANEQTVWRRVRDSVSESV